MLHVSVPCGETFQKSTHDAKAFPYTVTIARALLITAKGLQSTAVCAICECHPCELECFVSALLLGRLSIRSFDHPRTLKLNYLGVAPPF